MSVVFPWDYNDAQRMGLTSGTKLGPYEIVCPLGAGGMGEVYRARDTRLDRSVAIKILPAHLTDNPEAKQRFDREARAISSLNHPNICTRPGRQVADFHGRRCDTRVVPDREGTFLSYE
jgi:serine/threonine protein kinase